MNLLLKLIKNLFHVSIQLFIVNIGLDVLIKVKVLLIPVNILLKKDL